MASAAVSGALVRSVAETEQDRLQRIARAWSFYEGNAPDVLKVRPKRANDNVKVNLTKLLVLKGVSYLFGRGDNAVEWEVTDEAGKDEAEAYLDQVWGPSRLLKLKQHGINGAVTGEPFFRIRIQDGGMPRIIVLDPAYVWPSWEADDLEKVYAYRIQFTGFGRDAKPVTFRQRILLDDTGASWTIIDEKSVGDSTTFVETARDTWPYPFPPIVHNQNLPAPNEFWGTADLESDTLDLNRAINGVLSNASKIVRLFAHPRTVAKGIGPDQSINVDPDGVILLPNGDATLEFLQWTADLSASLALLGELREFFHETSRVPEIATGRVDNIGALSGVALHVLYEPLLELTDDKRGTYGEALVELNRRLLVIGGKLDAAASAPLHIHWPEIVPSDPLSERSAALIDQQLGVSKDTTLTRLGFDPSLEAQKVDASQTAMADAMLANRNADGPMSG